jgi:hypothetical protein
MIDKKNQRNLAVLGLEEENRNHTDSLESCSFGRGRGTRIRPFTYYIPKAMIPMHGKPLVRY